MERKKVTSFLDRLKEKAKKQEHYGGDAEIYKAKMVAVRCSNCGAGRSKDDGITKCAYCGFEFMNIKLTDGMFIRKEDNSL